MVKTYLKFEQSGVFGVISSEGGAIFDFSDERIITGGLELVTAWHIRKGTIEFQLLDEEKQLVTFLCLNPNGKHLAAGYHDGRIRIWNLNEKKSQFIFNGHDSAISCLSFNSDGTLLVSGSRDTSIIVWDIVNESGLYRLRGHKDMVTNCLFFDKDSKLISSSKDSFVKIWDLETQHCVQTLVGHRNEVWSIAMNPKQTRLITGSVDSKIRVWSLDKSEFENIKEENSVSENLKESNNLVEEIHAKYFGSFDRQSTERVSKLAFNYTGTILACQAADTTIEFYNVASEEHIQKKLKKRNKRIKKKLQEKSDEKEVLALEEAKIHLPSDEFSLQQILRTSGKIYTFSFSRNSNQIVTSFLSNKVEIYKIETESYTEIGSIELPGHRYDIRDVQMSYDNSLLLSTSNSSLKIWNLRSLSCIQTISSGYGLCAIFVPGNRHVILGTKKGHLEIYDLSSGECIEVIQAHQSAIWSLDIHPDKTGFISGSEDKDVKFWEFDLISKNQIKLLTVVQSKILKMSDEVLSVKYSPNGKLFALSLLDNTIKVFYTDSLKFFLSLYGHKLPVMSLDISYDSTLLVSGSADKNIKIWGLDFGDCHKSIFAHDDTIVRIKFVPKTHYFFTSSKDKKIKYWDADKFEHIQTLEGHHGYVWGLCISSTGDSLISGSQDKSLRIWKRTNEPLFLEEEREKELEQMFLHEETSLNHSEQNKDEESSKTGKKTIETLKAGERLIEALELAESEKLKLKEYEETIQSLPEDQKRKQEPFPPNPLLLGLSSSKYVLKVLKDIRSSDLDEALMVLPFASVCTFFNYMNEWIEQGNQIELICRCLFLLLKFHNNQIVANKSLIEPLTFLRNKVRQKLQYSKDLVGFNRYGMQHLKRNIETSLNAEFFEEEISRQKKKKKI